MGSVIEVVVGGDRVGTGPGSLFNMQLICGVIY